MKKFCLLLLAFVLSMGALAGCGEDNTNKLVIWSAIPLHKNYESALKTDPTNRSGLYTQYVLETFAELHPDVTVQIEDRGWAETLNEEIVRTATTTQPDIIGTESYTQNLIDLDYLWAVEWEEDVQNDLIPASTEIFMRDGGLYATPIYTNSLVFLYNEQLLFDAGCPTTLVDGSLQVLPPETWAEVLYCCERVQAYLEQNYIKGDSLNARRYGAYILDNVRGVAAGFRGELYASLGGGSLFKEGALSKSATASDLNFNDPANVLGYELMRELYSYAPVDSYAGSTEQEMRNRLLAGQVAMTVEHPDLISLPKTAGVDLRVGKVPVFTDGTMEENLTPYAYSENNRDGVHNGRTKLNSANILAGNVGWGITKSSEKKEQAMDFIRIALSPEAQVYLYELDTRLPSTKSGIAALKESTNSTVLKYADAMKYSIAEIENSYSANPTVNLVGGIACFEKNIADCWISYETFTRTLYTTQDDIQTALNTLQSSIAEKLS